MFSGEDLASFKISGTVNITGNKATIDEIQVENNICLFDDNKITVTGELTGGAKIGVNTTGAVATGFTQEGDPNDFFIPDDPEYNCVYVSDGTVNIGNHNYDNAPWMFNYVTHWQECQNGCGRVYHYYHNFNQEVVSDIHLKSAASCIAKAVYYISCECGAQGEETFEYGEKIAHTPAEAVRENETAASCTQVGSYDEVVYCSVCNEELGRTSGNEIPAPGHTEVSDNNAKAPTCTETGLTDSTHCSVCDTVLSEQTVIVALGHTLTHHEETAATEQKEGNTEYWSCSECNKYFSDGAGTKEITDKSSVTLPKLTPDTPVPEPAEEKQSYLWILWLLIPLALAVGGITLGIWVYKEKK